MPIYTKTLPQLSMRLNFVTLKNVLSVLPDALPGNCSLWVTGKLARYGQTSESLPFLSDATPEQLPILNAALVKALTPLGSTVILETHYEDNSYAALQLYDAEGLLLERNSITYTRLPQPTPKPPILDVQELYHRLPRHIPWSCTVWLTGGLVRVGWTGHDVDMVILDKGTDWKTLKEMRNFFTEQLGWLVDIGMFSTFPPEPIYLYKLYETGNLLGVEFYG